MRQNKISGKRVFLHVAFWAAMVLMFTVNYVFAPGVQQRRFIETIIFLPGHMFFAYAQMYMAVPLFLLKRKYTQYVLYSFLFLSISVLYAHFAQSYIIDWHRRLFKLQSYFSYKYFFITFGRSSFALLFTAGLAVSIKLFKEWFRQREVALKVENEKVRLELESLRSQIHPHFLFNTLNNLYSLTLTSSASASMVVVHLSDLLRYMLYECRQSEVPVERELQMLKKYIELEKLRYGNRLDVAFTISGEIQGLAVSPLLLLPFVENSFKHGVSDQIDQCWININVHVEKNVFTLKVSNSRVEKQETTFGGLGMENVRKRLQLLYPETHDLKIVEENEIYVVKLELILGKITEEKKSNNFQLSEKTQVVHTI